MKKLFLSAAILGLGTFAMAQQTEATKAPQQMHAKKGDRLVAMQKELNLSDAQVSQLKELYDKKRVAGEQKREANKADFQKRKEQHEAELKGILTPAQFTKWQSLKEEKMKERKSGETARKSMHRAEADVASSVQKK